MRRKTCLLNKSNGITLEGGVKKYTTIVHEIETFSSGIFIFALVNSKSSSKVYRHPVLHHF